MEYVAFILVDTIAIISAIGVCIWTIRYILEQAAARRERLNRTETLDQFRGRTLSASEYYGSSDAERSRQAARYEAEQRERKIQQAKHNEVKLNLMGGPGRLLGRTDSERAKDYSFDSQSELPPDLLAFLLWKATQENPYSPVFSFAGWEHCVPESNAHQPPSEEPTRYTTPAIDATPGIYIAPDTTDYFAPDTTSTPDSTGYSAPDTSDYSSGSSDLGGSDSGSSFDTSSPDY